MTRIERMIRNVTRRLAGRDGTQAARRPPIVTPQVQQAKDRNAASAARDARRAVDSFTAAMERAMRGQT